MKLVLVEINGTLRIYIYIKVLELGYSEQFFYLISVFNELKICLRTIESLLLEFMKLSFWPYGPQK